MTWFLGPVWDQNGDPELVRELVGRSWSRQRHGLRTLVVVDDYGNAVMYQRRCPSCKCWRPLTFDYFVARIPGPGLGMQSRCSACDRLDHEIRGKHQREHINALQRAAHKRRMQDADYRARQAARLQANRQAQRAKDPEAFLAHQAALARDWVARKKKDKEWVRRRQEAIRIDHRLRRERLDGVPVTELRRGAVQGMPRDIAYKTSVPGPPLAKAVQEAAEQIEVTVTDLCSVLGISDRAIRRWEGGEGASFGHADRVLVGLELLWWDIWTPETVGYERARAVFEGRDDKQTAA